MTSNTMTERTVRVMARTSSSPRPAPVRRWFFCTAADPAHPACRTTPATSRPWHEHFRVLVPDMPGYGRSAKGVDRADPFGYLADHIRGMLDELGIQRAHLVGNSYGGSCALRLALDTPHRVDRLVLMGPGGVGTTRGLPTAGPQEPARLLRR